MPQFIESLESRTFLSVSPSLMALQAEQKAVIADLVAVEKNARAGFKLVQADLKAAGELPASRKLLRTLEIEGGAAITVTARGVLRTQAVLRVDIVRLVGAAARVARHPTSATLQAKLTAAANTLSTDAANRLAIITNDLAAPANTNQANFQALVAANPTNTQLATDGMTIGQNTGAAQNALADAATTALTTDVANLIASFA